MPPHELVPEFVRMSRTMRFTIRNVLVATMLVSVPIAIWAKLEFDRERAEQIATRLQLELNTTERNLKGGSIYESQLVDDYLAIAAPSEREDLGRFSEFRHGFTGGLGHGVTVVSKDGRLIRAYFWSCVGGEEYFNGMTDEDDTEFGKLWSWAHPPPRNFREQ